MPFSISDQADRASDRALLGQLEGAAERRGHRSWDTLAAENTSMSEVRKGRMGGSRTHRQLPLHGRDRQARWIR
jgi:hypothetical protein